MNIRYITYLCNIILALLLLLLSFYTSWMIASKNNFFYDKLYYRLEIKKHINKYSLRNSNYERRYFYFSDDQTRMSIFREIVFAINHKGKNLNEIYFNDKGKKIKFLTKPEIEHLEDVAKLVNFMKMLAIISFFLFIPLIIIMKKYKIEIFGLKKNVLSVFVFISILLTIFYLIGFKKVFYFFHEIFFKNSQWFFYYEDSLMTTLMKAPDIFGYISLILLVLTFAIYIFMIFFVNFLESLRFFE